MKYKLYGFFRLCEICDCSTPMAVGIAQQNAALRLIKYRCLRKKYTPAILKEKPKNFEIREIVGNLAWAVAYTLATRYQTEGLKVLTCSRT